jgi:hypothetical protein
MIAHHESGHIVGAWRAGIVVTRASVDPAGDNDGVTQTEHLSGRGPEHLAGSVVMLLAGGAAEKEFAARHGFACDSWPGAERDILRAVRLASTFLPAAADDFVNDLVPATKHLVAEEWDTIERVAQALFACGSLSGAELLQVARSWR